MKLKKELRNLGDKIERMNQVALSFPLWIAVGVFGSFRKLESDGWEKSEDESSYGKMY